jgi:hypothetical protein
MPDPPLPIGDGPREARGDTGEGAGARPATPDERNLSAELDKICMRVDRISGEHAAEAG